MRYDPKMTDGIYHDGSVTLQFPITPDEEQYKFHLCQWVHVAHERPHQQVHSRKIENACSFYLLSPSYEWFPESEVEA